MTERSDRFEVMLTETLSAYEAVCSRMDTLRAENKTKTATYQQLMADKFFYQRLISLYRDHGLIIEKTSA